MINIFHKQEETIMENASKNRKYDKFRPKNRYMQKSPSLQSLNFDKDNEQPKAQSPVHSKKKGDIRSIL